jgi:hypothetical protein
MDLLFTYLPSARILITTFEYHLHYWSVTCETQFFKKKKKKYSKRTSNARNRFVCQLNIFFCFSPFVLERPRGGMRKKKEQKIV